VGNGGLPAYEPARKDADLGDVESPEILDHVADEIDLLGIEDGKVGLLLNFVALNSGSVSHRLATYRINSRTFWALARTAPPSTGGQVTGLPTRATSKSVCGRLRVRWRYSAPNFGPPAGTSG
jgi:hypothetical protein